MSNMTSTLIHFFLNKNYTICYRENCTTHLLLGYLALNEECSTYMYVSKGIVSRDFLPLVFPSISPYPLVSNIYVLYSIGFPFKAIIVRTAYKD